MTLETFGSSAPARLATGGALGPSSPRLTLLTTLNGVTFVQESSPHLAGKPEHVLSVSVAGERWSSPANGDPRYESMV